MYTVIYTTQIGYTPSTIVRMERFACEGTETVGEALDRLGIDGAVYIFEGWPKLEGEMRSDSKQ